MLAEKEKIIEYAFSNCVLYSDYCKSKDIISVNQGIREDSLDNELIIEYLCISFYQLIIDTDFYLC